MLRKGVQPNRRIIILALPPVRELDLAGIVEVFGTANSFLPSERHYSIEVVTPTPSRHVDGMFGLKFLCERAYRDIKGKIDTLLIPGGLGAEAFAPSRPLLQWVRKYERNSRRIGSICTGCFLLAKTGILDGRRVTTHWEYAKRLAVRFPTLKVDFDPIWIRDGNIYSSAGVTSGIDLCLALVEEDHGRKVALSVARMLVVFLCRPGSQAQFSAILRAQEAEHPVLRDLQFWMIENLGQNLSLTALAARAHMSERHFHRIFTREMGKSPARFVEEIRMEAARRKLEQTADGLKEIATACGFGSTTVMERSFQRLVRTTPAEYRERFGTSGA